MFIGAEMKIMLIEIIGENQWVEGTEEIAQKASQREEEIRC